MLNFKSVLLLILSLVIIIGCGQRTPKRDHIKTIKSNLYKLQVAVSEENYAAIDSLLSPSILDVDQGSDSLVKLVYGENSMFAFEQFGQAEIIYTTDQGRIDCYIMDSTHTTDRPFVLYLKYDHELWLFSSFKEKEDSLSINSQ